MAEDAISSIIDIPAIEKQIATVDKQLDDLAGRLKTFPTLNLGTGVSTLKEYTAQTKAYAESLKGVSASTKVVLDAEKLAAIERKRIAQERTDQAKLAIADLKLQQVEIKKNAIAEKEAAAISKQAANEAVNAGKERILQLKAEAEAEERLAAEELARANAEQQALSGTYNPGNTSGTKAPDTTTPAKLSVSQGDILLLKTYETEISKLNSEVAKSKTAFQAGEISLASYQKTVAVNTEKINALKTNVSSLSKEINLNAAVNNAERNSLDRARALIAQYTNEKTKLNLATADGARLNDSYNKAIQKSNDFILKNADAETQRTKNIGNYGSALNKVLGPIRTLANILPGIGLSGLFLAGFEALKYVVDELGIFNTKLTETARQRQLLAKVQEDSLTNYGKEAGELKILRAQIESTSVPMATRLQAIKNLKKEYPDYFKGLSNEQILTGEVGKAYDLAAAAILRKAQAQAAASEIEKNSAKELKILQDDLKDSQDTNRKIAEKDYVRLVDSRGIAQSDKQQAQLLVSAFQYRQNLRIKERDQVKKDNDFLLKFAVDGAKETVKIEKDKSKAILDSTKATLDSDFEIYKIAQQRKIKLLEDGVNDETKTYDERIALLQEFSTESLKLNDAQTANDKRLLEAQLAAQQANVKKVKGTERNNLLVEIQNTQTKLKTLDAKNFDERLKIFEANQKKFTEVEKSALDQEEKARKEAYDQALKDAEANAIQVKAALDRQYETRLQIVNDKQDKGLLTEKEANKQREKLEFDYHTQSIRNELAYAKKILEIQKAAGIDTVKQQEAIAKLAADLEATIAKGSGDKNKDKLLSDEEYARRKKELYKQLYAELTSTIFQFLDDGLKREEQDLDERKRLLDEDTARRISNIEQLGLTEVERTKQTAAVEKQAQFQTEQIEARKRAIEVQRAKYEKAASIANIVVSTAEAVISALKVGPPQGFVLAALAGAIGAAQLARAISTPLPKYRHGRGPGKAEMAIVGDGGQHEFIRRANGNIEMTPSVPTLTHLEAQDIVYKDQHALARAMLNASINGPKIRAGNNADGHILELINEQRRTTKAIQGIKTNLFIKNMPGITSSAWYEKQIKK